MAEPPPLQSMPVSSTVNVEGTSSGSSSYSFGSIVEGLDYEFVPNPDNHYICAICLLVLRDPCQTSCGHRFCKNCILKWLRISNTRCPIDNKEITENDLFPDNFAKREIENFNVCCPNSKNGCDVITIVKHLNSHLKECPLALVPCPNKCSSILQRRDLDEHVKNECDRRNLQCSDCGTNYFALEMEAHSRVCPQGRVQCKHCKEEVTRQLISNHEEETCPEKLVPCDFCVLGCDVEIRRCDKESHVKENMMRHMTMLCQGLVRIFHHLGLPPLQADRTLGLPAGMSQESMSQMMVGMVTSLQTSVDVHSFRSAPGFGYQQQGNLSAFTATTSQAASLPASTPSVATASISVPLDNGGATALPQPSAADPSGPPAPTSTIGEAKEASLMGYWSDASKSREAKMSPGSVSWSGKSDSASKSMALSWQDGERLVLHTQKLVELQAQMDKMESMYSQKLNQLKQQLSEMEGRICNGEFFWKIKEYSKYQCEAERGQTTALHSQPFYTSLSGGYRMCLRANLNGVDSARGSHLSLFVHFMQGEYDSVVDWPFNGKIVLSVIDQNDYCELRNHFVETLQAKPNLAAFQRPSTPRNHKGFGYMEFVLLSALKKSYVKDDTLIIKAHVLPSNTCS